jgi:hypothetical protein
MTCPAWCSTVPIPRLYGQVPGRYEWWLLDERIVAAPLYRLLVAAFLAPAIKELDLLGDRFGAIMFYLVLILPIAIIKPSFNGDHPPLRKILVTDLGQLTPCHDGMPGRLFMVSSALIFPAAICSYGKGRHGCTFANGGSRWRWQRARGAIAAWLVPHDPLLSGAITNQQESAGIPQSHLAEASALGLIAVRSPQLPPRCLHHPPSRQGSDVQGSCTHTPPPAHPSAQHIPEPWVRCAAHQKRSQSMLTRWSEYHPHAVHASFTSFQRALRALPWCPADDL